MKIHQEHGGSHLSPKKISLGKTGPVGTLALHFNSATMSVAFCYSSTG